MTIDVLDEAPVAVCGRASIVVQRDADRWTCGTLRCPWPGFIYGEGSATAAEFASVSTSACVRSTLPSRIVSRPRAHPTTGHV
jgi:hypothetical protein